MVKLLSAAVLGLSLVAAVAQADVVIVLPTPHHVHHRRHHRHFRVYRDERGFEHRQYYD